MKISVVIPTFNGEHRISTLLRALEKQSLLPDEIIVVIDGSTDNTKAFLKEWKSLPGLNFIYQSNKGRAGARNAGAERATGDCIIFYDDDMHPSPESVKRHAQSEWRDCITAGQQIETFDNSNEFSNFKQYLSKKWVSHLNQHQSQILLPKEIFLSAANMSISKRNFQKLNGFDAHLKDAEDFDLAIRAFSLGINIQFDPLNLAHHRSFLSFRDYILRQREYRKAHQTLMRLRKGYKNYYLYEKYSIQKSLVKKLLYFFFIPIMVRWMDKQVFGCLPAKGKYALYTRVISALSIYYPHRSL